MATTQQSALGSAGGGAHLREMKRTVRIRDRQLLEFLDDCLMAKITDAVIRSGLVDDAANHQVNHIVLQGTGDFGMSEPFRTFRSELDRSAMEIG